MDSKGISRDVLLDDGEFGKLNTSRHAGGAPFLEKGMAYFPLNLPLKAAVFVWRTFLSISSHLLATNNISPGLDRAMPIT